MDLSTVETVPPPVPARHHLHHHQLPHDSSYRQNQQPQSQHEDRSRPLKQHAAGRSAAHQSPNREASGPSARRGTDFPPASPEVISNLISSLSELQPASDHRLKHKNSSISSPAVSSRSRITSPASAGWGSGFELSAAASPSRNDSPLNYISADDVAAISPVVRTAKPPSGYSNLTAPRSPRSAGRRSLSHDSAFGLRSFIRGGSVSSRASSSGSVYSNTNHDDAQSIGNPFIERAQAPDAKQSTHRSHDSRSGQPSRSGKALARMTSKDRLREPQIERRHAPVAANGEPSHVFLAGTPIREEQANTESSTRGIDTRKTKLVPDRESSLRQSNKQSKNQRARHSKTSSDDPREDPAPRMDQRDEGSPGVSAQRGSPQPDDRSTATRSFLLGPGEFVSPPKAATLAVRRDRRRAELAEAREQPREDPQATGNGRVYPEVKQNLKLKSSESKLTRLSLGPKSPPNEPRASLTSAERTPSRATISPDRPSSADSIDDAVETYLHSPRLSQKIRHPQSGRLISFSEVGDANGSAVFCCVGMGLTRYITAFYDELALTLKLRLITPDRPGVGDSEPYNDGTTTPLSWPDDVYAICQALKITKFSILAHSAGAIYALATALRMPQHIRGRLHLLAPWIPPSQMNVYGTSQAMPPSNAIPTSQKILRALPTPILKAANSSFMTATSSSITSSLPKNQRRPRRKTAHGKDAAGMSNRNANLSPDDASPGSRAHPHRLDAPSPVDSGLQSPNAMENMDRLQRPAGPISASMAVFNAAADAVANRERQHAYDTRLTHAIWQLATTGANPAVDLLVCLERRQPIGFRYVDITRPVIIHHGSRDNRVPVENVKWLGKTMRRCEVRLLEGEGHGLMASAAVMSSVLMEMSKEWEDWIRATGTDGRRDRERSRRGTLSGR